MKIVTTPMCEEIVKIARITDYAVNKHPSKEDGDFAILLSESKVDMDCLSIKLNTSSQIFESIKEVCKTVGNDLSDDEIRSHFKDYELACKYLNSEYERDVDVKVYSDFLKDIVLDVGFNIVSENPDFVIYPDYLKEKVMESNDLVEIPSHSGVSKNPFERIEARYAILENLI